MYGYTLDPLPLELPAEIEHCAPINEEPDTDVPLPPYDECSPTSLFAAVHGGKALHQGLKLTWNSLNQSFICSAERNDGNLSHVPESSIWTYP